MSPGWEAISAMTLHCGTSSPLNGGWPHGFSTSEGPSRDGYATGLGTTEDSQLIWWLLLLSRSTCLIFLFNLLVFNVFNIC